MIEIIEHMFGLCGESHPNLLIVIPILGYVIYKIRKHGITI